MATIRIPQNVWKSTYSHLFSRAGEHFAFLLARWTSSNSEPVFMVHDVVLVPDEQILIKRTGWELTTEGILNVINTAVRSGDALIEVHNHGGSVPRFSSTDREGLIEFPAYVLDSLPGRPYGATVWGDSTIYGEYFLADGKSGTIQSIAIVGDSFQHVVSRSDDLEAIPSLFDRQLPWFTKEGQRRLSRLCVAVAGAGGTGSQVILNLVFLGIRNFILIDYDTADDTSMNRLATAIAADVDTSKIVLGRRFIKSVAPNAIVKVIDGKVQSAKALDALKGADIIFGCFDNDGARLILNELALAYDIPYFDLGVGIDANNGKVSEAGGRVAIVIPGGPCLHCMGQINREEARYFLSSPEEQAFNIAQGYIKGMDVKAPSVVSLNAAIAATAVNEFSIYVSGLRSVNPYTELDLLGVARPIKSQWLTPMRVERDPECLVCTVSGIGDGTGIERYSDSVKPLESVVIN